MGVPPVRRRVAVARPLVSDPHAPGEAHRAVDNDRGGASGGCTFTAKRLVQSMSRKGDCWDNAVAESFFSTLEHELLADADFHSRYEAQRTIFEFIGLVQPRTTALDPGLRQPSAVRTTARPIRGASSVNSASIEAGQAHTHRLRSPCQIVADRLCTFSRQSVDPERAAC